MSQFEKLMNGESVKWGQRPKKMKECNLKKFHKANLNKSKSKYKRGYMYNDQGFLEYHSSWEEIYFKKLDMAKIKWKRNEELRIPYKSPLDNKFHHYIPDYFLLDNNGKITDIKEIKPHCQLSDPVVQAKAIAAKKYCEERGWKYGFITEREVFNRHK